MWAAAHRPLAMPCLPADVQLQCSQQGPGTGWHCHDPPRCLLLQKWQRRFFILYEHGLLRYALDEMVSAAWLCPGISWVICCPWSALPSWRRAVLAGFDSVPGWVCVGAQWTLCRGWWAFRRRASPSWRGIQQLLTDPTLAGSAGGGPQGRSSFPPPFCPVSQCQLGFGCGESPWQCPRRRPCLAMPVENRSAGTTSHCLPALALQLVTSTVPIGERGSKEGKSIHWELQSGAEEPSRSIPGAPRTADLSCWLQQAH